MDNLSTAYRFNKSDARIITNLITAEAEIQIDLFQKNSLQLSDYAYWYLLSTLYVNDSSIASVSTWKTLFQEKRPNRSISLMKPDELSEFKKLPNKLILYRAHSKDETDWISYTLNLETAIRFAKGKKVNEITEYRVKKNQCLALFLRREENEILCMNNESVNERQIIRFKKK